jgi:GAF domain-containing protein
MSTFSVDLTKVENWNAFNEIMGDYQKEQLEYVESLAQELGVSVECAEDVNYLRSRSRHTEELEAELIRLHKEGNPPNIFEFG